MTRNAHRTLCILAASLALGACGNDEPRLMNLRSANSTPDEFAILPSKPLEQPEEYATLPTPTPGGVNRTDRTPEADAIAALGGNVNRGAGADRGLVAATTRYGVTGDIRSTLAREDLELRKTNDGRVLERLFNVNTYYKAYADQSLDTYRELQRLRNAGVRTVAAPPEQ